MIESGQPELVTAWQQLNGHISVVAKIGAIASQFGCRPSAQFPQIREYAQGDNFRLTDAGIMCTAGPLMLDSARFQQPDQGHRTSPWARTELKLHTVAEAQARYDEWAAEEFDRIHSGPRGGWIDANGQVHTDPVPPNPYRQRGFRDMTGPPNSPSNGPCTSPPTGPSTDPAETPPEGWGEQEPPE